MPFTASCTETRLNGLSVPTSLLNRLAAVMVKAVSSVAVTVSATAVGASSFTGSTTTFTILVTLPP